jgi:cytochrome b
MALKPPDAGLKLPMPVWDLPTRLFHWALPVLLAISYISHQREMMELHQLAGFAMTALLLFRLGWGFVGSDTARFARFLASPPAVLRQLGGLFRREPDTVAGHGPVSGWMALILLLLLAAEAVTGLCATDGSGTAGPLAAYVGRTVSDRLSRYHAVISELILAAVALHLLIVAAHAAFKGQNLVRPMLTGRKRLPAAMPAPRMVHSLAALALLGIAAALVFALVSFA